jgi:hypothetical protein
MLSRCKRCRRKLKDAESIERKYGPHCYKMRSHEEEQLELMLFPAEPKNKLFKREMSMADQYAIVKRILSGKGNGQSD